jgi:hypothetical protein
MATKRTPDTVIASRLEEKLGRLKRKTGVGYQVRVEWRPGEVEFHKGRRLREWVEGDTI